MSYTTLGSKELTVNDPYLYIFSSDIATEAPTLSSKIGREGFS